jgi:hypothetical protein
MDDKIFWFRYFSLLTEVIVQWWWAVFQGIFVHFLTNAQSNPYTNIVLALYACSSLRHCLLVYRQLLIGICR